jgi:sterol desaturase/sphingolipid hydroxylase (fatty acid hydroxylase superfamily)
MIPGEYNHWWCIYLVSHFVFPQSGMHISAIIVFILLGGVLASFNHTRFDLKFPVVNCVYQVKYHDVHHWYPNSNYGQYTMLWDWICGSFKDHPSNLPARSADAKPVQNGNGHAATNGVEKDE